MFLAFLGAVRLVKARTVDAMAIADSEIVLEGYIDPRDTRDYLIRTLEVHRMRLKNGVGEHHLRNWPTSY